MFSILYLPQDILYLTISILILSIIIGYLTTFLCLKVNKNNIILFCRTFAYIELGLPAFNWTENADKYTKYAYLSAAKLHKAVQIEAASAKNYKNLKQKWDHM